jgi:hypothetical protein
MMKNLIDDLGGASAIAEQYGLKANAVSNWRSRGVPWRYRPMLAERAKQMAITLPDDFLDPARGG